MSDNEPEKGKKKFKMPNTYVILFGVICFIAVLSWFVPGGAYELNANGDATTSWSPTRKGCGTCSWRPSRACWVRAPSAVPSPSR